MTEFKTEGIILHALNYRDYDQILTIFTQDLGLIKLMVKSAHSKKNAKGAFTAPLTKVEFIYKIGRSEIFNCLEISPINQHLQLRNSWEFLSSAGDMVKALLASQMPHKPARALYDLLNFYFDKILACTDPKALAASFRMKILRYEGLLQPSPNCSVCQALLTEQRLYTGQSYCCEHAPEESICFTETETDSLLLLTFSRSLAILTMTSISEILERKISLLFTSTFE